MMRDHDIGARVDLLAQQLSWLMDERAITRLIYDYGVHLDYGNEMAWQDLFTPEASYELHYRPNMASYGYGSPHRDGDRLIYQGHAMLLAFATDHTRIPHKYHKHFVADLRIDLDGDDASATSYFARLDESEHGVTILAAGRYIDDFKRCDDERWRFRRRIAEIEMKA